MTDKVIGAGGAGRMGLPWSRPVELPQMWGAATSRCMPTKPPPTRPQRGDNAPSVRRQRTQRPSAQRPPQKWGSSTGAGTDIGGGTNPDPRQA
ncbi:hypothetical protein GCM10028790_02270 [Micromonospora taraxaci]